MKSKKEGLFPMFMDLSEREIVVIGAGNIARRRVTVLSEFSDRITVIAPQTDPGIRTLAEKKMIRLVEKEYRREDLYGADIVIAATDDPALNDEIYSVCKCLGIMVNVISDKNKCDFHFPGIVKRDHLVIGVNAGGKDHKLAKTVREKIDELISQQEDTQQ